MSITSALDPCTPRPPNPDYEPVGLDLVRYAARKAPVAVVKSKPWFAIGGISLDNLDAVIEAGARRVCVVRAITEASDPQAAADRLSSRLRAAWKADPAMERYVFQALSEQQQSAVAASGGFQANIAASEASNRTQRDCASS